MADPTAARIDALAAIRQAQGKTKISQANALAALLSQVAAANLERDTTAIKARGKVIAADNAARAKAQSDAQAAAPKQPDVTQFFQPVQINPADPIGSLQALGISPGGAVDLSNASATGGQTANQSIVAARQAAGTLPRSQPAPTQQPTISVGGEDVSAPATITTTQNTTAPLQYDVGAYVPYTTSTTTTRPNVITAGDILRAKVTQEEAQKNRALRYGEMILTHGIQSVQARAAIASTLMQNTNAPPAVAGAAADAALSGNTDLYNKLVGPYDTTGKGKLAVQFAQAKYFDALRQKTEAAMNLEPGSLFDPLPLWGFTPVTKAPTGNARAAQLQKFSSDLNNLLATGWNKSVNDAQRSATLTEAGSQSVFAGNGVLGFRTDEDTKKPVAIRFEPRDYLALRWLAGKPEGAPPEVVAAAQKALEDANLGAVGKDGSFDPTNVEPIYKGNAINNNNAYLRAQGIDPNSGRNFYLQRHQVLEGPYLPAPKAQ